MKRLIGISLGVVVLASATNVFAKHNGNVCAPIPGDISKIGRYHYGVHNVATTSAEVWCPIDRRYDFEEAGASLRVVVFDRHTTQDVVCTALVQDNDGDFLDTQTVQSSSSGAASQLLAFNSLDPVNGNTVVKCIIPPVQSGNFSHVVSFDLVLSP